MPNKIITISSPVLQAGEYFEVRYRLLPSGAWVNISPQDNDPFTIVGLTEGNYALEVTLFSGSPAVPCETKTYFFDVEPECGCPANILASATQDINGIITVIITSDPPPAGINAYYIQVIDTTTSTSVVFVYPLQIQNYTFQFQGVIGNGYNIAIWVNCDLLTGLLIECVDEPLEVPPPPCTGISGVSSSIWIDPNTSQEYLRILFIQSTPATISAMVSYIQTDLVQFGSPDGGSATVNPLSSPIMIPVTPNRSFVRDEAVHYDWNFYDSCGNLISGSASS